MLKVNTLFIMTASILVLLMTPGLAFLWWSSQSAPR